MKFIPLDVSGGFIIEVESITDERGDFGRSFCKEEFEQHGLDPVVYQCNISNNVKKGTLRGMHFQEAPHEEAKLVRCTRGAIWDVLLDLRSDSETYLKWHGVELTADNNKMVYVPKGFAHGFKTLEDDAQVFYQMSAPYVPGAGSGVRWDDPSFGIEWPEGEPILSEKDRNYPDYEPIQASH